MAKKKKVERKYFVITNDYDHKEWYWEEKQAREKAKELTLKTAVSHYVAVQICQYEPATNVIELPNGGWR